MTTDYDVVMPVLSIRFKQADAYDRLRRHATEHAESISGASERLIDEGLRMAAHPGIVFRDGPSGRRAGLAAGPDVWEVVALLRGVPGGIEQRVATSSRRLGLTAAQVRIASHYYAEYPDEIDAQVATNDETADRELGALGGRTAAAVWVRLLLDEMHSPVIATRLRAAAPDRDGRRRASRGTCVHAPQAVPAA